MSQRKATMKKIREILRLKSECGLSLRKISAVIKLSRPVITEYLDRCERHGLTWQNIKDMPDDELEKLLQAEVPAKEKDKRYATLADQFEYLSRELKRVGVTRQLLWEEYRAKNLDGYGYSQFCYHLQAWEKNNEISMHIEHKAGDKMFVDYAGEKFSTVNRITGEIIPAEVFVALLGASQFTYVEATRSQKKQDFIQASVNALHYMGGVPAAIVPDNLKSAVTKASRYEPDINPEYIDLARYYDTTILPARPYKPRDKSLVEGAVRLVYQRIYAALRDRVFYSIDDLNVAIREELERYNKRTMKGYGKSRLEMFNEIEKTALRPLPVERFIPREFARVKAQFNYHVYLKADKHYYSLPYKHRGTTVDIFYSARTVEIYHNNVRIAFHLRDRTPYRYTTLVEHMPPEHQFMNDWNAEKFLSWAQDIGDNARSVIETVLLSKNHPEQSYKSCLGILNLVKRYGRDRFLRACARAIEYDICSYRNLCNILENNMDSADTCPVFFDSQLPVHENIRGSEYYTLEEQ